MNETEDEAPVDLQLLALHLDQRAARVTQRLVARLSASAMGGIRPLVRARLERVTLPMCIAAAAAVAFVFSQPASRPVLDPFTALVIQPGPARGWIASGRAPELGEVSEMIATGGER